MMRDEIVKMYLQVSIVLWFKTVIAIKKVIVSDIN